MDNQNDINNNLIPEQQQQQQQQQTKQLDTQQVQIQNQQQTQQQQIQFQQVQAHPFQNQQQFNQQQYPQNQNQANLTPQQILQMQQQQQMMQQQYQMQMQQQMRAQQMQQKPQMTHQQQMMKQRVDAFELELEEPEEGGLYPYCLNCCGEWCGKLRQWCPCFCCFINDPMVQVDQSSEGLLERYGRYVKTLQPSLHFVNPLTEKVTIIDKKIQNMDLVKQVVLTNDNITAAIDASVNFKVINSRVAVYKVYNYTEAVRQLTYTVLRNLCGQMTLQDILEKKDEIKLQIQTQIDECVHEWGVVIENVFIKDVIVQPELQEVLATASKEKRLAESKVISAKADVETAKMMRQAADALNNKSAMQIRYLETLERVCTTPGTKVIFYPKSRGKELIKGYR